MSWDETKHERGEGGRFAPKGGGGGSSNAPAVKAEPEAPAKTYTVPGVGSLTKDGSKTTIKVSWLGKAALETAAGAAVVAALPEVLVGAVGVAASGLMTAIATKAATVVGKKVATAAAATLAPKLATAATKAAGKSAVAKVAVGAVERKVVGSSFLKLLKGRLEGVHVETEAGWFKPSTITIDRAPKGEASFSLASLRKAATEFSWDSNKHKRDGNGRFASVAHASAANAHLKSSISQVRAILKRARTAPAHTAAMDDHEKHVRGYESDFDQAIAFLQSALKVAREGDAPPVVSRPPQQLTFLFSMRSLASAWTQFSAKDWKESDYKRDGKGRFSSTAHAAAVASHYESASDEAHGHLTTTRKIRKLISKSETGGTGNGSKAEADGGTDPAPGGEPTEPAEPKAEKTEAEHLQAITASVRRKELRILKAIATLTKAREIAESIPAPSEPEPGDFGAKKPEFMPEPPGHAELVQKWGKAIPKLLPWSKPAQHAFYPPETYEPHREHMSNTDAHYELGTKLLAHIKDNVAHKWCYDAVGTAHKAGWQIPPVIRHDEYDPEANGWLDPSNGHLYLTAYPPTADIQSSKKAEVKHGVASQENTMLHEMAHWQHLQAIGTNAMMAMHRKNWISKNPELRKIALTVSERATLDPLEFVAETYAGHAVGKQYSNEVKSLFLILTDGKLVI